MVSGRPRRGDDDLVAAGEFELDEPVQGFGIALFDDQLDVELALWVVERVETADQVGSDARLTIKRDDNGVVGKFVVGERGRTNDPDIGDRRHRPQQDHGGKSEPKRRGCNGLQRAETRKAKR